VPDASPPEFSDGLQDDDLGEALFRHALWPASMYIANGEDPQAVLESLAGIRAPSLNPERVGEELFHDIPLAAGQTPDIWPERFSVLEQEINGFLQALELASGVTGLAESAGRDLERRILESSAFGDRMAVGSSYGVRIDLAQSIDAIDPGPGSRQVVLVVTEHSNPVGTVALLSDDISLTPAVIADIVVEQLAWPIMRNHLKLRIPPDNPLSLQLKAIGQESNPFSLLHRILRCSYLLLKWQKKNGVLTNRVILRDMMSILIALNPVSLAWGLFRTSPGERKALVTDALTLASRTRVPKLFDTLAVRS
jgi:hypothetical protein